MFSLFYFYSTDALSTFGGISDPSPSSPEIGTDTLKVENTAMNARLEVLKLDNLIRTMKAIDDKITTMQAGLDRAMVKINTQILLQR